jgi:hypothetical protein
MANKSVSPKPLSVKGRAPRLHQNSTVLVVAAGQRLSIKLTKDWKLITRPAVPISFETPIPDGTNAQGSTSFDYKGGLGDIQLPFLCIQIDRFAMRAKQFLVGVVFLFPVLVCADGAEPDYVGRAQCTSCHEDEVTRWTGSHHDLAMRNRSDPSLSGTPMGFAALYPSYPKNNGL